MTLMPMPEPDDDDAAELVSETEAFLADTAAAETRRVRRLRAEVTEAHLLAELQDDDTPLFLDSPRVRRRRKAAHQAARLHQLAQDPTMRAWQASRMRRVLVCAALVALALALGWSTAGVQAFAAEGAGAWSARWLFAWCVEPFMSLALLTVVGAKAYMSTRGQPIESTTLTQIEALFLTLTLGMNAWPHLPFVAAHFSVSRLVLHVLGPVVAVAIVAALPIILAAFARLDHGSPVVSDLQRDRSVTRPRRPAVAPPVRGRSLAEHRAELHRLVDAGELPAQPSAEQIRKTLGCRREVAAQLRDEIGA